MSGFVKILLLFLFVVSSISAKYPYHWFVSNKEIERYESIASCVNWIARYLFNSGNRLAIICKQCGPLSNKIAKLLVKEETTFISSKPFYLIHERMRSYVILGTKNMTYLRKNILGGGRTFARFFEYLIVLMTKDDSIHSLSRDMWKSGFRYFSFLLFNDHDDHVEIAMPGRTNKSEFALQIQKVCTTTNGKNSLTPFYKNICLFGKCVLHYGGVADETVKFWRREDKFRPTGLGARFVQRYSDIYNMTIDASVSRNLNWSEAARLLYENKVDIVNGLIPDNIEKYEGLQILCWYMSRSMVFAAQVQHRGINDILQLLMPFHYSVWIFIACLSMFYLSLVYVLNKFWQAGLMREYIRFAQVCQIVLAQGITFPKKTGLRIVLGLWMVSSHYLSIIYESTFTSSLAKVNGEILLKNLQDLRKSNQPFGGPNIVLSYLNDTNEEFMIDLRKRYQIMTSEEALEALRSNNTMIVLQHFTVDNLNWINRANRSLRIYTLPEPILHFPIFFFTRKGHPYYRSFQLIATRTRETGLMDKWNEGSVIDEDKRLVQDAGDGTLTMTNLRSIFHLFLICTGITFFTFFLELLYYNLQLVFRRLTSTSKAVPLACRKRDSLSPQRDVA